MTKAIVPALLTLMITLFNCSSNNINLKQNSVLNVQALKQISDSDKSGGFKNVDTGIRSEYVPGWYRRNRVQILTLLQAKDIGQPYFLNLPKKVADIGASVITRDIKSGDEQPWWVSKYGTILPAAKIYNVNGSDLAKNIIDQIHSLNMKAIIYYRHQEDSEMLANHSDWACLDVKGNTISTKRGTFLSLNSPYRYVVIERVKELALYGADGFVFDEIHIPITGDFSSYSQKLYKKQFGSDLVSDYKAGNIKRFYDFRNSSIQKFFDDLRDTLNAANLNPLIIVSGNSWPTLNDLHMTSDFYKNYTLKSELEVPNRVIKNRIFTLPAAIKQTIPSFYNNAFYFSFMRDNTLGPPYIWAPEITTQQDAQNISAGLISLGCIAELGFNPSHKNVDITNFKTVFQWNKLYGNYFEKMVPYAVDGIVVSENQRNQFIGNADKAWSLALMPSIQAFEKLYQNGIPVKLVSDAQLNNLQQLKSVYANKSLPLPSGINGNKFLDLKDLPNTDGLALAQKLGSPVFCKKDNEFTHINYFTDKDGYMYVVTAPDFNSVKKNFNEKAEANMAYTKSVNYNKPTTIHIYIKKENNASEELQDLVNNNTLKPSANESGYAVFDLAPNASSLGLYRFKFQQ